MTARRRRYGIKNRSEGEAHVLMNFSMTPPGLVFAVEWVFTLHDETIAALNRIQFGAPDD